MIVGTQTDNMLPRDPPGAWDAVRGIHGYTRNMTDMATVFYARGPGACTCSAAVLNCNLRLDESNAAFHIERARMKQSLSDPARNRAKRS